MATVMVENLQFSDTEEDVRKVFGKFGKLVEVRMGRTRAFVTFEDLYDAKDAVRGADGHNGMRAASFCDGWMVKLHSVEKLPNLQIHNNQHFLPPRRLYTTQELAYFIKNRLPVPPIPEDVPEVPYDLESLRKTSSFGSFNAGGTVTRGIGAANQAPETHGVSNFGGNSVGVPLIRPPTKTVVYPIYLAEAGAAHGQLTEGPSARTDNLPQAVDGAQSIGPPPQGN
ncbi:PREDICTED: uncharacterized protein LOC101307478 [Fragaria vesca subsp. vesca]|uniref:serine/arginine-rich splicing factor RS31-like n=1 Tax=Fragaria vesca subsp. vesca TaxID=101020 RepID=UPI0002C35F65|nr:PREDICTED: serine/arginine-rich splicing factor RS31-like [Fragaria vesca subsp. vesca]